jgi:hypothetical protein
MYMAENFHDWMTITCDIGQLLIYVIVSSNSGSVETYRNGISNQDGDHFYITMLAYFLFHPEILIMLQDVSGHIPFF